MRDSVISVAQIMNWEKSDIWGVVQQNYDKSGWKTLVLFKGKTLNSKTLFLVVQGWEIKIVSAFNELQWKKTSSISLGLWTELKILVILLWNGNEKTA